MSSPTKAHTRADIAAQYLHLISADIKAAEADLAEKHTQRLYYIRLGRREGLTHQAIGDILGITEGAVRGILTKAGTALECGSGK